MSQPWNPPPVNASSQAPNNNLVFAIIATVVSVIFCCIPHGLVSLIFALQVDKKAAAGDIAGATELCEAGEDLGDRFDCRCRDRAGGGHLFWLAQRHTQFGLK